MPSDKPDLTKARYADLVGEIRNRSSAALIAVILKDAHPEANIRVSMHVEKGTREIELVGLATIAHADALEAVRSKICGPQEEG